MDIHTCLWNDVSAFDFTESDLALVQDRFPHHSLLIHQSEQEFLAHAHQANILLTWDFPIGWYASCHELQLIVTPAAGNELIDADPDDRIKIMHGTFHGQMLGESLLEAILFMNHRMPGMIDNFQAKSWDRERQADSRLLANQVVLIIGLGNIGRACARLIAATGARVIGVRKNPVDQNDGIEVHGIADLNKFLPLADHVVMVLPGGESTDRFMNPERLKKCKPGAYLYNFGRGNALQSSDLIDAWDLIGGAFLDVTDEEPLPSNSPLWQLDNIMITPHSSCIYSEYKSLFLEEAVGHIQRFENGRQV